MDVAPSRVDQRLLESLDRAFARHAGPKATIDAAAFKRVLGLRTDALAARMFALFDHNGDGAINRDEFIATISGLIAGSERDKLAFAFRLHDEDGDGNIDEAELRRIVGLSLGEDNVSIEPKAVDHLARSYFARADRDGDGRISFDEFATLSAQYPTLLAHMVRTEARWIAPNEDLLARLEPATAERRAHAFANRRRARVVLAVWIALHVAVFASALFATGRGTSTWLDRLGRGCTGAIELDVGILVLAAMRRLVSWLRATWVGRVLPIDDAIAFHRLLGHAIVVFAIGHGVARIVAFASQTRRPFVDELLSLEGLTGVVLVAILGVMWWFARAAIRRSRRFELFYYTHLLYLPFLVLAVVHAPAILVWGGAIAILVLVVEHGARLRRRVTRATLVSSVALRSGVTRLELGRPAGFSGQPGDYVFVRIPEIARHEWHPFTLSSAPEAATITAHVRSLGNWTSAVRERVEQGGTAAPLSVFVDGPYGSPSRHVFDVRFAVMIGAGIGVTPFASILESFARRAADRRGALEQAHFFWLNRDQYSFEWFAVLLAELEANHADRLDLHIHLTGGRAGLSAAGLEVARELLREQGDDDLITGLQTKTHMGHPDWERELAAIRARHAPEPVHVFLCGPEGLSRTVAAIAARLGMPFREEKF